MTSEKQEAQLRQEVNAAIQALDYENLQRLSAFIAGRRQGGLPGTGRRKRRGNDARYPSLRLYDPPGKDWIPACFLL